MPSPLEKDLIQRAQNGDERAFAALAQRYERPVLAFVFRLVNDRELAEDLTQETFLRVWRALPGYAFRSQLGTWIFQVAKNVVRDDIRARQSRPRTLELVPEIAPAVSGPSLEQTWTIEELWLAIAELSSELRTPLLMRDVAGHSYKEIAETLDISLASVKWRIYTARQEVQFALLRAESRDRGVEAKVIPIG